MSNRKSFFYLAVLSITVLFLTGAPVSAQVLTIGDSGAATIQDAINTLVSSPDPADTVILPQGLTYNEHDIVIKKAVTIRAGTTYSGSVRNPVIDAQSAGRIFDNSGGYALTLENLTLQNGHIVDSSGGAIVQEGGSLTITRVLFSGCSATESPHGPGGGSGGAIFTGPGTSVHIDTATFYGCTATVYGGAILQMPGGSLEISNSGFTSCQATNGGAIESDNFIITRSEFTGCTATTLGGAILSGGSGGNSITGSTFTDCRATSGNGGAVYNAGIIDPIRSSTFTGCQATYGGAIYNANRIGSIISSSFTGCSATDGGAIYNEMGIPSLTSSSFTGNSATSGGAIYISGSDAFIDNLEFCRFYDNSAPTGPAITMVSGMGRVDSAANNWWGTSSGPAGYTSGVSSTSPWLVLNASAAPSSITTVQTSTVMMKLTNNSAGTDTIVTGNVPDGIPVAYSLGGVTGSLAPGEGSVRFGTNSTVFDPSSAGTATITVTVDGESVAVPVVVSDVPTTVPTTSATAAVYATPGPDNDDGFPSVTPTATQAGSLPPMTVTVNIGGDSKAWQAIVTGTELSELIVTGTVLPGPGSNVTAPPGTVFQYISLVPARFTSISNAVIHFSIPQSWLDENHIDKKSIVLYHQTANGGWEALPTTVLSTKDGSVYFSAQSTGFSLFAIAGTPPVLTPTVVVATPDLVSTPVQVQPPAPAAVTKVPVTTQTTAPPAATPQPAAPSPLLNIVLVIAAIGILAGGGFMVRRWWIHRQNPALFMEYN